MDRVTVLRLILAGCLFGAGILSAITSAERQRVHRLPRWVSWGDSAYFWTCMWGTVVLIFAVLDHAGPVFVRDWLSWALPPIVAWPALRRWVGLKTLVRGVPGPT